MKFSWRPAGPQAVGRAAATREPASTAQVSPGLRRALERIAKLDDPEILDAGSRCGETAIHLAGYGGRVCVDPIEAPDALPGEGRTPDAVRKKNAAPPPRRPLETGHPEARFDLVIAWELLDFTPPERLADVGTELHRILADKGWLLLYSVNGGGGERERTGAQALYRLFPDGALAREERDLTPRRCWAHPTRDIEQALAPLSIQGIQLQRNQMREIIAVKRS